MFWVVSGFEVGSSKLTPILGAVPKLCKRCAQTPQVSNTFEISYPKPPKLVGALGPFFGQPLSLGLGWGSRLS